MNECRCPRASALFMKGRNTMKRKAWIAIGILCFVIVTSIAVAIGVSRVNSSESKNVENEESLKNDEMKDNQFDATVTDVQKEYIMVQASDGQTVSGEVHVWIGNVNGENLPKIKVGDTVRITHDGKMTMSLPPQMSATELRVLQK